MKLGQKASSIYGNHDEKDPTIHPHVSLPASMFKKNYKVGDTCHCQVSGTIENMGKDGYHVKLTDGHEIESGAGKSDTKKSIIANAVKTDT